MKKLAEDLKLIYVNDLYKLIIEYLEEENYTPRDYFGLMLWLDNHNIIISILPELYSDGINWLWLVNFYNPNVPEYLEEYSTGLFGDNGEYKTRSEAIRHGITTALEIFLLRLVKCGEVFSESELLKFDISSKDSLLELKRMMNEGSGLAFSEVGLELYRFNSNRKSGKEFINYVKERIIGCLERVV